MRNYADFLASKAIVDVPTGLAVVPPLGEALFDFQRDITAWSLRRGRAAIFADCGLGKTPMQLEWAKHIPGNVLILAPLAVAGQTVREGQKFGIEVSYARRQGIPDYLVTVRKPGTNPEMVSHTAEDFPVQLWQNYASPVWMDINPSDTLSYREARENEDERHICALQLQVIERAIKLWSNPGDTVFSPFAGIGSEGYVAVKMGRRFLGAELKRSYWQQACKNLDQAKREQHGLFAE